jgi:hypothetical protein
MQRVFGQKGDDFARDGVKHHRANPHDGIVFDDFGVFAIGQSQNFAFGHGLTDAFVRVLSRRYPPQYNDQKSDEKDDFLHFL